MATLQEGGGSGADRIHVFPYPPASPSPALPPPPSVIDGFTPSHRLHGRFLKFTEFLLHNLGDLNNAPLPLLPPPTLTFFHCSGQNEKAIKGRLPHRVHAISASLSSRFGDHVLSNASSISHIAMNMTDNDAIATRPDSKRKPYQMHSDGEPYHGMDSRMDNTSFEDETDHDLSSKSGTTNSDAEHMGSNMENISLNGSSYVDVIEMELDIPSKMNIAYNVFQENDDLHQEMKNEDGALQNGGLCSDISGNPEENLVVNVSNGILCLAVENEIFVVENDDVSSKMDYVSSNGDKGNLIHMNNGDSRNGLQHVARMDTHREILCHQVDDQETISDSGNTCNTADHVTPGGMHQEILHKQLNKDDTDMLENDIQIVHNNLGGSKDVSGREISCIQIGRKVIGALQGNEMNEASYSLLSGDIFVPRNTTSGLQDSGEKNRSSYSLHCDGNDIACNTNDSDKGSEKNTVSCSFSRDAIVIPCSTEGIEASCSRTENEISLGFHKIVKNNEASCSFPCNDILFSCNNVGDANKGNGENTVHNTTIGNDKELEEGELSEHSIDNNSLQEESYEIEIETRTGDVHEFCKEKFQLPSDDEMDVPIGTFLSQYYSKRSVKRRNGQQLSQKCALTDINSEKKKKQKLDRKRKAHDNNGQFSDVDRATGSETIDVRKGKKMQYSEIDADLINKKEAADTKKPSFSKGNTSARQIETSVDADLISKKEGADTNKPSVSKGNASARQTEASKKSLKGRLSKAIEEEVGLWTTDAGDDQILSIEEGGKKPRKKLTAERRKKKQKAKHRRNAEKQEKLQAALGIRKISFKPAPRALKVQKGREVKFCEFYMMGKCNKGANCTFSHNAKPRCKPIVCKYFLNNCCLKGDDCLFSHALSTFPCKYFHIWGHCSDMSSCRFSHQPISKEERQELLHTLDQDRLRNEKLTAGNYKVQSSTDADLATNLDLPSNYIPKGKIGWFAGINGAEATKDDGYFPEISYSAGNENGTGYNDESSSIDMIDDRKAKAMQILQASLDANQHVFKRKSTMIGEKSVMYNPSSQTLPGTQYSFGFPSLKGPKVRSMETLQSPVRNSDMMSGSKSSPISRLGLLTENVSNGESRDYNGYKPSGSDASMSSSLLLDKFLKPTEARTQNRFTSVDSLLTKILNE